MQNLTDIIISFTAALAISYYLIPMIVRIDQKLRFYEQPITGSSGNKMLKTLGGFAIFPGFVFASSIGISGYQLPEFPYIIVASMLIFSPGLNIDIFILSPLKKMLTQLTVSFILVFLAKIRFSSPDGLFESGTTGVIPGSILAFITIIVIVNAFGVINDIVGLASGLTLLLALATGMGFAIANSEYAVLSFSLAGAVSGFLFYNLFNKHNKIALGNSGAIFLGVIISVLLIRFDEVNTYQNSLNTFEPVQFSYLRILNLVMYLIISVCILMAIIRKSQTNRQLIKKGIPLFQQPAVGYFSTKLRSRRNSRRLIKPEVESHLAKRWYSSGDSTSVRPK